MYSKGETPPKLRWLFLLLSSVVAMWGASWWLLQADQNRGTFGDMFGGVNALFSGLAFAALIFTVWMQRIELSLQRKELQFTREELRGQKEQLKEQNKTLTMQRFENTFFELLKVHGQIVESIDLKGTSGNITKGRDCFRVFYARLKSKFDFIGEQPTDEQALRDAREVYESFFELYEHELGHYFRHLYHIIKFVKQSDVSEKRRYTNFVRAQLSSYELSLLFYDGISGAGVEKLKPLIEEFALLKHLPVKLLFQPDKHFAFYHPGAYGNHTEVLA